MNFLDVKFNTELQARFIDQNRNRSEVFYLVTSPISDSILESVNLLRWSFGIDLYSSITTGIASDSEVFRFSHSHPYSIFTSLVDGCLDVNLRYLVLFPILHESTISEYIDPDDLEFQVYMDLQDFDTDLDSLMNFIYFIGFGSNQLISYAEFHCSIQYLIRYNFGSNIWMSVSLIHRLCFSFLTFTKFE